MQTEGTSLHAASGCTVDKGSDRLHADPQAYQQWKDAQTIRFSHRFRCEAEQFVFLL